MTVRRKIDLITLVSGVVVFVLCAILASNGLAPGEERAFVVFNSLPDLLYVVIWPFMQFGVFITIPILVLVAVVLRRYRVALALAIGGVGVYLVARVVKELVNRGRPAAILADVHGRETFTEGSLGFPSGHAAVAGALTVVLLPYLSGRWRYLPVALLVIVGIGRMYVGAHLPLDLIGGAALGIAAGAVANLIVGVRVAEEATEAAEERPAS